MYRVCGRILRDRVVVKTKLFLFFDKRHNGFDKENKYINEMTCSNTHV